MSNEISRRLVKVVDNVAPSVAPEERPLPEVDVGQIWIAAPDEGPAVLVLITDVSDDHVQALMCSSQGDMATETDAELAARSRAAPIACSFTAIWPGRSCEPTWWDVRGGSIRRSYSGSYCAVGAWTSTRAIWGEGRRSSRTRVEPEQSDPLRSGASDRLFHQALDTHDVFRWISGRGHRPPYLGY